MTRYLLDTNHVSAMLRKSMAVQKRIDDAIGKGTLGISTISVAELWYMVFNSTRIQENTGDLNAVLQGLSRFEFSEESAKEFGRLKAQLRKTGRAIPDPDSQIAAIARVNGLTVLTADAHFANISDLKVENWLA